MSPAPSNTVLPTISGIAQVGQTLMANIGTWSGSTPITFSYTWSASGAYPLGQPAGVWNTLVFSDDFDGTAIDTAKWTTSWFGGASQNNVATSPANVSVANSILSLTLSSSTVGASVTTNPTDSGTAGHSGKGFTFTTGYYVEASIKFPGPGTGVSVYDWPAFWTDGQNWPANGETDIAEALTQGLTSNYHVGCPGNVNTDCPNNGPEPQNQNCYTDTFHTFGFDREAGTNKIYWDGNLVRSYSTSDGGAPHYIILNIGKGEGPTVIGSQLQCDYVRVWSKA